MYFMRFIASFLLWVIYIFMSYMRNPIEYHTSLENYEENLYMYYDFKQCLF